MMMNLPTVLITFGENFAPVSVRMREVLPTPESPRSRILYVTSHSFSGSSDVIAALN